MRPSLGRRDLPAIHGVHEAWRYTLLAGLIPAIPLIVVRPFLPESPVWREKKSLGKLERPSFRELFQPTLRRTTLVTTLLMGATSALAFGAIQHTARIVPGLADVRNLPPKQIEQTVSHVQVLQELGGVAGRVIFALLVIRIASERRRMRDFPGARVYCLRVALFLRRNADAGSTGLRHLSCDAVV